MSTPTPSLSCAYKLGRILEELASVNRREAAMRTIKSVAPDFNEEGALTLSQNEIDLTRDKLFDLSGSLLPFLPGKLVALFSQLDESDPKGMGLMEADRLGLLHSSVAGMIEESMTRQTVWNCLQAGRLSQRCWLLVSNIRDTLKDQKHMPGNHLLSYIAMRTDNPVIDFQKGTHLWNVHKVFHDVLKAENHPKSLVHSLNRLATHISDLPKPDALKRSNENVVMTVTRISNDLEFIDVHELIGDDPEDHLNHIVAFFDRHQYEAEKLIELIKGYLKAFESFMNELADDEFFEYTP